MSELAEGKDEVIPHEVAQRLLDGESHPLRVWREYRGFTQEVLAAATGVGKSYISQIESGRKSGSLGLLRRVAEVLRVEVDDLLPPADQLRGLYA